MAAKKKPAPRKKAAAPETSHPAFAVMRVALRNVINMTIVSACCAITLATLMAAFKLQLA